jgi:hypothetical protein
MTPIEKALMCAVNMLSVYEPPDSRAVSDEFVALAAVASGDTSERVMTVIEGALARQAECGAVVDDLPVTLTAV